MGKRETDLKLKFVKENFADERTEHPEFYNFPCLWMRSETNMLLGKVELEPHYDFSARKIE